MILTCSSNANPRANYKWYKDNEKSPKALGQTYTITNIRAEHSGNYYCEAMNRRGYNNSASNMTGLAGTFFNSPPYNNALIIQYVCWD